jgi:hypothetical protein
MLWLVFAVMMVLGGCILPATQPPSSINVSVNVSPVVEEHVEGVYNQSFNVSPSGNLTSVSPQVVEVMKELENSSEEQQLIDEDQETTCPQGFVEDDGRCYPQQRVQQLEEVVESSHSPPSQQQSSPSQPHSPQPSSPPQPLSSQPEIGQTQNVSENQNMSENNTVNVVEVEEPQNNESNNQSTGESVSEEEVKEAITAVVSQLPPQLKQQWGNVEEHLDALTQLVVNVSRNRSSPFTLIQRVALPLFTDPNIRYDPVVAFALGNKSVANTSSNFSVVTQLQLNVSRISYSSYSESSNIIKRVRAVRAGNTLKFEVTFTSPYLLYAYLDVFPLTLFVDVDGDGQWDYKYVVGYNREQRRHYYYIYSRGDPMVNSRDLEYNLNTHTISFDLQEVVSYRRVFVWLGEESTHLRFPQYNDLVLFTRYANLDKNHEHFTVFYIDDVNVEENGDWQQGELRGVVAVFASVPLEEVNAPEAQRLAQEIKEGKVNNNHLPDWFRSWLVSVALNNSDVEGLSITYSFFPVFKWIGVSDNQVLFTEDRNGVIAGVPVFASNAPWLERLDRFSVWVGLYDVDGIRAMKGTISDLSRELFIAMTGSVGEVADWLFEGLMFLTLGKSTSVADVFGQTMGSLLTFFDSDDVLLSTMFARHDIPPASEDVYVSSQRAGVTFKRADVFVPAVPLNVTVKLRAVKVKDRSDALWGEFYLYGRVCTDVYGYGLKHGQSFSWPAKKFGDCNPKKKLEHDYERVWDGDVVARNFVMFNGTVFSKPFLFIELEGWDEDREDLGDDDDFMGALAHMVLLNESNFRWDIDSNVPHMVKIVTVDTPKAIYRYEITVN